MKAACESYELVSLHDSRLQTLVVHFEEQTAIIALYNVCLYHKVTEVLYSTYSCKMRIIIGEWEKVSIDHAYLIHDRIYNCDAKVDGQEILLFLDILKHDKIDLLQFFSFGGGALSFTSVKGLNCEISEIEETDIWEGPLFRSSK